MRHRKASLKLNRTSSHRRAMFRNMVTSLFKYDRIRTTDTKAKELRVWADRLITLAKRGDLHARRQALSIVREKDIVHKLFDEANDRFGSIAGGYTRIIKVGRRPGDAAPISIVELLAMEKTKKKKAKKKEKVALKKEPTTTEEKSIVEEKEDTPPDKAVEELSVETSEETEEAAETIDASPTDTETVDMKEAGDTESAAAESEEVTPEDSMEEAVEEKSEEKPEK